MPDRVSVNRKVLRPPTSSGTFESSLAAITPAFWSEFERERAREREFMPITQYDAFTFVPLFAKCITLWSKL